MKVENTDSLTRVPLTFCEMLLSQIEFKSFLPFMSSLLPCIFFKERRSRVHTGHGA
jgi:hypothetical protein